VQLSIRRSRSAKPLSLFGASQPLGRLWKYRSLVQNVVARDLKLRYRNSVFGFIWSLLNPLLMMGVFTIVFMVLLHTAPTEGAYRDIPFPLFLLTGILAWNYLAISIAGGMSSIVGNAGLVTKVYFPREVLPVSAVLSNTINFLLALVVFIGATFVSGIGPALSWLYFPLVLLSQTLFVFGIVLFIAALNVYYRDTEVIMEVFITAWFFMTPIFYDITQVVHEWHGVDLPRLVRIINPMASYITSYRDIFLLHSAPDPLFLLRSFITGMVVAILGYISFIRMSKSFGDVL